MHIVDDEQRSDRRATPMRPSGSGLAGTSASLALLDDVHRHRLRRAALHLPPPGQERGPFYYSDRLLVCPICHKADACINAHCFFCIAIYSFSMTYHLPLYASPSGHKFARVVFLRVKLAMHVLFRTGGSACLYTRER